MKISTLLAAAAALVSAAPASAVVYSYDTVVAIDSSMIDSLGNFRVQLPSGGAPTLLNGDELVGTIRFANNEFVTVLDNPARFSQEFVQGNFGDSGLVSFYWTLIGVGGEYLRPTYQEGSSGGPGFTTFGDLTTTSFSFTGADFRIVYRGDEPINLGAYNFGAYGGQAYIGAPPPAVPEPATWAMMIGGFGLVGGAMRRRVRAVALAA